MPKPLGRPRRKDSPQRISLLLSAASLKALEKLSAQSASRGRYIEMLIAREIERGRRAAA